MDENWVSDENVGEEEEEYVLMNLDEVRCHVDIAPNTPYVLSGVDTPNPILVIGDNLKLIGEYEETVGTCLVFSEGEATPVVHEETGPSEANLFSGKFIIDPNQAPSKEIKPIASLQKILKFRLLHEACVAGERTFLELNTPESYYRCTYRNLHECWATKCSSEDPSRLTLRIREKIPFSP